MTDFDPSKLPVFWQVLLYVVTAISGVAGYDRYKVYKSGSKEAAAGAEASATQYDSLEQSIENHTKQLKDSFKQLAELRLEMTKMDGTIHWQQIEITQQAVMITRMDGVISLLVALLAALGQAVPERVQREIDELVKLQDQRDRLKRRRNDHETAEDAR